MEDNKLDARDYSILRELDANFRQSFSKIGKKVGLSKNSVALRFEKLKEYIHHDITCADEELLGYSMVRIYYSLDFYNDALEKEIINEVKKHKNIIWAARLYGDYDLAVCLLVDNLNDLIFQIIKFDERFSSKINQKEILVVYERQYFRNNFIHKTPIDETCVISKTSKKMSLSDVERKILSLIGLNSRISIVEIARKTRLSPRTVSTKLKLMEKNKIIKGYFMTLNANKFNFDTFKLLIQVQNPKKTEEFEKYFASLKNTRYILKMLGSWDYEVDMMYHNITELQHQIEVMKEKFPSFFKRIKIISFGKRITSNKEYAVV